MVTLFRNLKSKVFSSDLNKKIFFQSFWILLGNVISKFVLLIATIFMTKFMGKEEYGQFGIIKSTILMFAMFAGLELGMTATKYISQYRHTNKDKVEKIIGISNLFAILVSLSVSALVFFFSKQIAMQINAPELYLGIRISSFVLFFSSINGIQNGILAGVEKFKELSINNALAGIISSLALVLTSKYFELEFVIIAFGFNFILLFLLNFITLRKHFYSKFHIRVFNKNNFKEFKVLWKFSLPAIFAGLMVGPVTWYCNYLLVNQSDGYSQMATFDIANQWRNTILFIPAALSQIALPMLSSTIHDREAYKRVFAKNFKINLYIGLSFSLFFVILSPFIINIYGDNYSDAQIPMVLMFLTTALITINNVIGQAIASQDKMWLGFFVNLLWAIVLIFATYILVKIYNLGAVGLSFAYFLSYIFHTIIQYFIIRKKL